MKIEEIIKALTGQEVQGQAETIAALKVREFDIPDVKKISKQWNPYSHDIYDITKRPNRIVKVDVEGEEVTRSEPVVRIALALQKLIVKRASSFLFGNEVKLNTSNLDQSENEEKVLFALKKILKSNKEKSHNKEIARELFKATEVAEIWYPVEGMETSQRYGFSSKLKIRASYFSPLLGDQLFPLFDDTGDMIAFSRQYQKKENGKEVTYFETYTSTEKITWKQEGTGWIEVESKKNPIGKIPVIYARQDHPEWHDVQGLIERLETIMSSHGETNDYHSDPTIFVKGTITSFAKKGQSGKLIESENGADAKYLSWDQAPESVKLEIENLFKMVFSITQTPDISFESVKGIGNITGIALKLMFLDAHLKVEDKKEIFDDFLTRRYNIVKAYIGEMHQPIKSEALNMDIEPEITPYMLDDERAIIENLSTLVGGSQIMSKKTAVKTLGWVENVDEELEEINRETLGGLE